MNPDEFIDENGISIFVKADIRTNDDVLYLAGNEDDVEVYYLFHLTYSKENAVGYPKYKKFKGILQVKEYIEQSYIRDFL